MKKLQRLAINRIETLSKEAQAVVLKNHKDMGEYCHRESGFGLLGKKLSEIEDWAAALRDVDL